MSSDKKLLSDFATVISGYAFKSEWFGTGNDKVIRIGDLQDGFIQTDSALTVDSALYKISDNFKIKSKDILMALSGATVGKIAVASKLDTGAYINQRVAIIRAKDEITADYLKFFFSGAFLGDLLKNAGGAAQPNLSPKQLLLMEIPFPPLEEQRRIASILDKADELRQKRQQAIEKLDQLLQATFIDMFGDPVSNPKGWDVKILEKLTTKIGSGSTPKGGDSSYKNEGISLIRSLNIYDGKFKYKNLAFIDEDQASKLRNVEIQKNDVLLNITGASVARCCLVPEKVIPARVNQHVSILRANIEILPEFLEALLISKPMKSKLLKVSGAGATREALTKLQLQELEIIVPPINIQNDFLLRLHKIKSLVTINVKQLYDLDKLFISSQNKAFSGTL
ncbi:Type-1 restriction enzyme EcoKI specificity protein [compost metagenome]